MKLSRKRTTQRSRGKSASVIDGRKSGKKIKKVVKKNISNEKNSLLGEIEAVTNTFNRVRQAESHDRETLRCAGGAGR